MAKATDASGAISQLFILSLGNVDEAAGFVATTTGGAVSENNAVGLVVGNFLATDGDKVAVTYSLGGTDANYFTIDSNGNLKLISVLDIEDANHAAHNYTVVITAKATDASPAISQLFVLSLGNVNEATGFVATTTGAAVSENNTVGIVVGNFLATDGDGAVVTYDLSGSDANYFTIDSNGNLKLISVLDIEDANHTAKNYSVVVMVKASDASGAISQVFVLTLGNIDEATGFVATTTGVAVSENNAVGVVVGNFLATDGDGAAVIYDVSGADVNYFTIDATGNLKLISSLDFEDLNHTSKNYSVVVTAKSSDASPAISQVFVLTLGNTTDPTGFVATTTGAAVSENNAVGVVVGNFLATDGDGVAVIYDVSGADVNYFTIDASGNLKLKSVLDIEDANHTAHNYTVVVTAKSSDASPAISQLFILTLGNIDEATGFVATTTGAALSENNAVGVIVGNFLATDGDGVAVIYDVSGADANYFTIDSNGNLKLKSVLDIEDVGHVAQNYTVVVTAGSVVGNHIASQVFVLSLGNVDEPTSFVVVPTSGTAISENNTVGLVVGNFLATDGDGSAVTYSLGGTDANYFTIDASGNLKCKSKLDFKDLNHTANNYSVVVVAKSVDASPAISQLFVLSLGNIDKATNFIGTTRGGIISENNAVGVAVASFRASDGDGVAVTYSVGGADADYFMIDTTIFFISGNNYLKLRSSLNYEDANHRDHKYSVTIIAKSTDASPAISQLFVLTVGNISEPTSFITAPSTRSVISENNALGVVVGNFLATDGDGAAVTYSLGGTDANYFTIDSNGNLKLKSVLDFEDTNHTAQNYTVVVTATSTDASPAISQLFVLGVGNGDDPTAFVVAPTGSAIFENNALGETVGIFRAIDGDAAAVTYSLSGADASYFSINRNGNLSLKSSLNYEDPNHKSPHYSVVVVAKSVDASPAVSKLFVLTVGNANEPTIFTTSRDGIKMLSYDYTPPRVVGIFSATDDDGLAITYGVSGKDAKFFNIDAAGKLLLISTLNYDDPTHSNHLYSAVVTARSLDGGSAISKLFVLTLVDKIEIGDAFDKQHADHTAYIDGTTATHAVNVGGIIGHDDAGNIDYANVQFHGVNYTDKVITHNVDPDGLQSTTVDYVVRGISDLESLRISFNGFTDTDGSKHNHWFFVKDDAADNSGHIVFDADGQNVNLHSFANVGGLATSDQINLLACSNYGIDGDFTKPTDLNLNLASDPLHQNIAGALTFDQFLALLGGSQHISFV